MYPSALPADPTEAAALLRSLTADRPVAVLADDADNAGQVRGILPGAGLVVVTSRYQMSSLISLDGARLVRLGPLEEHAAAELAGRIIARPGARPDTLAELARCCGHLPLAIRAAAARLAVRPHLRIEQAVGELAAARHRLRLLDTPDQEVSAAMQTSYDDLDPDTGRAYRLLALHPGPDFTVAAVAALLDTDTGTAATLVRPGRRKPSGGILARPVAVPQPRPGPRPILPGRWRIAAAFALPARTPPAHASVGEALGWCDAEQSNLIEAQKAAADLGLHALAWQFADTLSGWCTRRHDYQPGRKYAKGQSTKP